MKLATMRADHTMVGAGSGADTPAGPFTMPCRRHHARSFYANLCF